MNTKLKLALIFLALSSTLGYSQDAKTGATPGVKENTPHQAMYWEEKGEGIVQCQLCPRRCILKPGQRGFCRARENQNGKLIALTYGLACAVHVDPIEKKPFFHFLPATKSFSLAAAGCNLRCKFCQNWQISQISPRESTNYNLLPADLVKMAREEKCKSIAYTYTEPFIFYEYMLETAKLARKAGIRNVMHSAGYINLEPLRQLCEYMDAINIDLKGFTEEYYQKMSQASLAPVLETLKIIKEEGVHLEITNLIVPTENDDPKEIREMCLWIKENLGADTVLHFSRFWPTYKLANLPPTPVSTLEEAKRIAEGVGLKYVYIGNVPGHAGENTFCPRCKKLLIRRVGYTVLENNLQNGSCKFCNEAIVGVWK